MKVQFLIWMLIAATGLIGLVLSAAQGMTFAVPWDSLAFILALYGLSLLVHRRNPPAARLLSAFAQIFSFAVVGARLSYAAMADSPFPLADDLLSRADAAMGFDWLAWFTWVNAN